jgi:predicted amidophosphoribosyltransferase
MLTVPHSFKSWPFDRVSFLAERIERRTHIRWGKDMLTRTKLSQPQKGIFNRKLKKLNVLNTHKLAKPAKIKGQKILLFDDVFDFGATIHEISTILRDKKAQKICALVLASTGFSKEKDSSF